ncbi:Z1 domain-containing protein [Sulfurospirillum sp. 1612]|uniref:Z1 domain-containing protein n=1 Tax=Sulfurospirillum sp. 1612 TaxID=3094835 RepID=UPI002F93A94C
MNCFEKIKSQLKTLIISNKEIPTKEELNLKIPLFEQVLNCNLSDLDREQLIKEIISENQISIPLGTEVIKKGWEPWLHKIETRSRYYEDRYKDYLLYYENYPPKVVNSIFEKNEKILDYLENPHREGSWIKKGLVMGYVQSGKTANYISLINKAADVGYKLIILIAGIHNNLREQTQKRINEGFIGFDNLEKEIIGVGEINCKRRPGSLTSTLNDFKTSNLRSLGIDPKDYKEPMILVIKKNYRTLDNILKWLRSTTTEERLSEYPLLIIDDEADNASVNTKKNLDEATKINKQIREILKLFVRRCYVGYTATPFANIFINPENDDKVLGEDLFPEDFIIALEAPSNYVGAKKIFLDDSSNILIEIDDNEKFLPVKHTKDFIVEYLPESLYKAVYLFLLSGAIKRLRGIKNKHHSMLINVSFRIDIQEQIKNILYEDVQSMLRFIKYNHNKTLKEILKNDILSSMYRLWEGEYSNLDKFDFQEVLKEIVNYEQLTKVLVINSRNEPLRYSDYDDTGLNVIAIGGYSLSRGFTLEGLTISYFLRNTQMYDTLLQMGRWFGYRDKYEDLCKVFMRAEAIDWYGYIAEVVEELKEELKIMEYYRRSPRDYGLKIKDHPASLIVTARNKMHNARDAIVEVCYSNKLIETRVLSSNLTVIESNLESFDNFILILGEDKIPNSNNYLWNDVSVDYVINFLNNFKNHPLNQSTDTEALVNYIEKGKTEELKIWDVSLINISNNKNYTFKNGFKTGKIRRNAPQEDDVLVISGKNHRVGQPSDEKIGLTPDDIQKATEFAISLKKDKLKGDGLSDEEIEEHLIKVKPIGNHYREFRKKPLLILYIIEVKDSEKFKNVPAYAISFPKISNGDSCDGNRKGLYKVNQKWWEEYIKPYWDEFEEIEEENDK